MYILSIFCCCYYFFCEFNTSIIFSPLSRILLVITICFFMYLGGIILGKCFTAEKKEKLLKLNIFIWFVLYLIVLLSLTLFDQFLGRNHFEWSKELYNKYLNESFNIIPFRTIIEYIKEFNGLLSTDTLLINMFGNFILLMPFSFFVSLLFKKQISIRKFTLITLVVGIFIECLQFLTFSGSCDIDDIILNVLGAIVMFIILKNDTINNMIRNVFLLEKNEVNKEKFVKIVLIAIVIIGLQLGIIAIRQIIYKKRLSNYDDMYNYNLKIIDDTKECEKELEKFYEDEFHTYYFECKKSEYIYGVINNNEKYLIKDLLNNNPTKYIISIRKLQDSGLKFITKNKYKDIILKGKGDISTKINIDNSSILEIKYGNLNYISDNNDNLTYEIQLYLIPLKTGYTNVEIELYNNQDNKKITSKLYKVTVDDNLNVTYEN